ncbi:MAG: DUF4424 family protein, partial [Pontixanthobacter sp.]
MKIGPFAAALTLAFAISAPSPSLANDSEAEWALGGLVLKSNADISMDSEDLFISAEEVRVDYVYTNHADQPREVTIAFPLPKLPDSEGYFEYYNYPDWDDLVFETRVDGVPVKYEIHDRALTAQGDVTTLVEAEGWPINWVRDYGFVESLQNLPESEKRRLIDIGLLGGEDDNGALRVVPAWSVQRSVVRTQIFPAKSEVHVSHRYTPLAGGSVGGMLYPSVRKNAPEEMAEYRKKWCIDDSFLAGFDRKLATYTDENPVYSSETWLGYVLSSGANWRGPIKDFRLVVDKGSSGNLVSFCMNGVKKISPTQFEVKKQNFEPERDL